MSPSMDKRGVIRGKAGGGGLVWGKVDMSKAKPQQWYYEDEPCTVLEWGFWPNKTAGAPVAQKVRTRAGKVKVVWAENGGYPGLKYELLEHHPGNA